jgi:putative cell wall-binding protein
VRIARPLHVIRSAMTKRFRLAGVAALSVGVVAAVVGISTPALATTGITSVTVTPSPGTTGASSNYTITFVATSALGAGGSIALDASANASTSSTLFPTATGDYLVNGLANPTSVTGGNSNHVTLNFASGLTIAPGTTVTVVASGVINPTATSTSNTLDVWTSADTNHVTSAVYTIGTAVSGVSASITPVTASTAATYAITLTSSQALSIGDTITVTAPIGTIFPSGVGYYTLQTTGVAATEPTVAPSSGSYVVTVTLPINVAAGVPLELTAYSVINPATGTDTLSVRTSKDVVNVASNVYYIGGITGEISSLNVTSSPPDASSVSTYDVSFVATSALGIGDTITITAPAGTVFQTGAKYYTVQGVAVTVLPHQTASQIITVTMPIAVSVGTTVQVVASGVLNPAAGSYTLSAYDSESTTAATSNVFAISAATASTVPSAPLNLAGSDRFGTAITTSESEFPVADSAKTVVIARSDDYADALVGTTLAADKDGPLLFADGGSLTSATQAEIQRVLSPGSTVYVLGGTSAVPQSVATTLAGLDYSVVRYAGSDRYGTAIAVAAGLSYPTTVLLATGINFPDALSAGPAAAHLGGIVLLTDGTGLPASTQAYLTTYPGTVYAIGGPAAVADPSATPIFGADRYATAADVASDLFAAPVNVGIASGTTFPDALSGGAYQALAGGPIVLSDPASLSGSTSTYLTSRESRILTTTTFGGTSALSSTVQAQISAALGI